MTKLTLRVPAWLGPWLCVLGLVTPSTSFAAPDPAVQLDQAKNPQAVAEVQAGKRAEANAAWWGFDEEDATDAIQAAIRSGAKRVIVPNVGKDWIVRPLQLASDQELVLEAGVVITAMRGAYRGGGDSVLNANDLTNVTIRGYGATVRMQKEDYIVGKVLKDLGWNRWYGQYEKAEWRMALALRGCTNVKVEGLTLRDSGGDGIYVAGGGKLTCSKDIHLKDVVCENNYRQGISVISVDGLLVEDSNFCNTWGTPPSSGVDLEPDSAHELMKNVVFRNCSFKDNYGDGIEVFLANLRTNPAPVSILFDRCHISSRRGPGIRIARVADDGPEGLIEFRNCDVEGTEAYGLKVRDKSAHRARVRFVECVVRDAARDQQFADMWAPVALEASQSDRQKEFGGIDFVGCTVEDHRARPAILGRAETGLFDVSGDITVRSRHATKADLGQKLEGVTLRVREANLSPFRHVKVFAAPGRFAGWPANHGLWSWGNEILVGFSRGYYKDLGERHNIDREKPEEHLLARSLDGGETWTVEDPSLHGALIPTGRMLHGIAPARLKEEPWRDCPGGIDFTHPDFAITLRMTDVGVGPSRFYYSTDRGHRWEGPFRLPLFGQRGVAARTDYLVNGPRDCLLVLTASKPSGEEGRPFCARTTDGGRSWDFVSWINEKPNGYAIMPSTIRLSERELFTAIRCRDETKAWIETYRSLDNGQHWKLKNIPAPALGTGNPPSMIRLRDGRVCLTYGYRAAPFGMRARLSQDGGRTWDPEIILRDDGGGTDVGYPRTVQRPDGKIVTIYYFHDQPKGDRYIAATIWEP
jgi:hypothetical protein